MRLFLKVRKWQEDVGSYLRRWRKLEEQPSLMETWLVTGGCGESGEKAGLEQIFKDSYKRRRALTRKGSTDN